MREEPCILRCAILQRRRHDAFELLSSRSAVLGRTVTAVLPEVEVLDSVQSVGAAPPNVARVWRSTEL